MQKEIIITYSKEEVLDKIFCLRNIEPDWLSFHKEEIPISKILATCTEFWKCDESIFINYGFGNTTIDKIKKQSFIAATALYTNDLNSTVIDYCGIQERSYKTSIRSTFTRINGRGEVSQILSNLFYKLHQMCPSRIDGLLKTDIIDNGVRFLNKDINPSLLKIHNRSCLNDFAAKRISILVYKIGNRSFCRKIIPDTKESTQLYCLQACGYRYTAYKPFTYESGLPAHTFVRGTYYITTACLTCPLYRMCRFENPDSETIERYPNGCPLIEGGHSLMVPNITKKDIKGIPSDLLKEIQKLVKEDAPNYINYTGFLN